MTDDIKKEEKIPKKVVLKKTAFNKRDKYEKTTKEVEVPELNSMMGLEEEQTAIVKIRQLNLTEYMKSRNDVLDYSRNLVEGLVAASASQEDSEAEILKIWKSKPADEKFRLEVVQIGVIEPKLNRSDVVFLSEMFPAVIMRLSEQIIELTNQGASLKKNS